MNFVCEKLRMLSKWDPDAIEGVTRRFVLNMMNLYSKVMDFVFKMMDFVFKSDGFCIQNDGFCIQKWWILYSKWWILYSKWMNYAQAAERRQFLYINEAILQ